MAIIVSDADNYFANYVLHNDEWVNADPETKQRALNNAERVLYRHYPQYDKERRPISDEAVYEQALWLLRIDDSFKRAEQGVTAINIDGISLTYSQAGRSIAPAVISICGRKVGRSVSGRRGWVTSANPYINGLGDGR